MGHAHQTFDQAARFPHRASFALAAAVGGVRAGLVLVEALAEMQALEHELDGGRQVDRARAFGRGAAPCLRQPYLC